VLELKSLTNNALAYSLIAKRRKTRQEHANWRGFSSVALHPTNQAAAKCRLAAFDLLRRQAEVFMRWPWRPSIAVRSRVGRLTLPENSAKFDAFEKRADTARRGGGAWCE
jgi:hypothetical protein